MNKQNWTYKKLGEVCTVSAGQGAPQGKENYCEDGVPFVKAGNVEELIQGLDEYSIQKVNEDVARSHRLKLYKAGSVIFAKSGMSCMKGLVYTLKNDCYVVSHLAILTPKEVISSFLNYVLNYFKPNTLVKDEAYPSISLTDISNFSIPIPPLETQSQIVNELDLLQSIIDKQKAQLKELDNLAQAVFYDMFGDPVENDKGWETAELNDVCDVRDGTHDSPSYYEDGYPLITSKNVIDGKISFEDVNYISKEDFDNISKRSRVDDGDIIMPMIGTIGKPVVVKKDREFAIKNVALIKFISDSKVVNVYIQAIMSSKAFDIYMKSKNRGGNQKFIALGDIRKLKVSVPPLSLQQSFATKIESIEKQKAAINQSIAETQRLFDYTMDKYFG